MARFHPLPVSAVLVALLVAGCAEDPQEDYRDAAETVREAHEDHEQAAAAVRERREELAAAQQELNEAEQRRAQARERLEQAHAEVDQAVSDEILFRTIQRELLDTDRFDDAAIAVGVRNRVVTLSGTVPDRETREAALETAREQPGVRDVRDRLQVPAPERPEEEQREPASEPG